MHPSHGVEIAIASAMSSFVLLASAPGAVAALCMAWKDFMTSAVADSLIRPTTPLLNALTVSEVDVSVINSLPCLYRVMNVCQSAISAELPAQCYSSRHE